jgi:hypothetical protein
VQCPFFADIRGQTCTRPTRQSEFHNLGICHDNHHLAEIFHNLVPQQGPKAFDNKILILVLSPLYQTLLVKHPANLSGVTMTGNAPTPPIQRPQMMVGQPVPSMSAQKGPNFDANHQQTFQQMVGSSQMNGTGPPQRQPSFSETNGYIMQMGNPMQGQQMTQYMGGQMPQHRVQAPMGFGPNGHPQVRRISTDCKMKTKQIVKMMAGGVVDPGMIGGSSSSQQIMGQMPPGMNSQSGMMANGAQMIQGPRQAGPPQPVSTAPQTMMVPQSPGLMAAVCFLMLYLYSIKKYLY